MTPEDKTREEREKILRYSRQKFHAEGFYKTSMDEIAKGLGMSKKTIYKHFPSKQKLVESICESTACAITDSIDSIVDADSDVVVKFVRIMDMYSKFTMNIGRQWLRDLRLHSPGEAAKIDELRRTKTMDILGRLLTQGKKEGLIENYSSSVIINTFTATITSIMNPDFLIHNKLSVHKAFRESYSFLLNGLLTAKGKKRLISAKALYENEIAI